MKTYSVTVLAHGKRHQFPIIAKSWYQAFCTAVDSYGVSTVVVKPLKG